MMKWIKALAIILIVGACEPRPQTITIDGKTMGTSYRVVIVSRDGGHDQQALREVVEDVLAQVNATFSNWDPQSEVSRINADRTGDAIALSADMIELFGQAQIVHSRTAGKFDVTLGPLIELWGFGAPGPGADVPSNEAIGNALTRVGQQRQLLIDPAAGTLQKRHPETTIYLAAIAKGTGIDKVSQTLIDLGFDNFMVEIGGDLYAIGDGTAGQGWRIGIEEPDVDMRKVDRIVAVSDRGMATSGDYRNYFEENGIRYSHIIDADTGRPVVHSTASVTVLAENAALADAWATALLVLGSEQGLAIAEDEQLAAFFIDRSDNGFERAESSAFAALVGATED